MSLLLTAQCTVVHKLPPATLTSSMLKLQSELQKLHLYLCGVFWCSVQRWWAHLLLTQPSTAAEDEGVLIIEVHLHIYLVGFIHIFNKWI